MTGSTLDRVGTKELPAHMLRALERRSRRYFAHNPLVSFEVRTPSGSAYVVGPSEPAFSIVINDSIGAKAVASLDQMGVATAYLKGHISIEGDLLAALRMRKFFSDFHPLAFLGRWMPMLLSGRREHDRRSISRHYDEDSSFFLSFLDTRHHCYTQGVFASDSELLEDAMTRKLDLAIEALGVGPGGHVLEVGGGWGAFAVHAARRGIKVTTLTLAAESEDFLKQAFEKEGLPARVVRQHFLDYHSDIHFDAIVNMGVTEHLPDYRATLAKYVELLRPGGHVYLDALAMRRKYHVSTFMKKHIYPGNSAPLLLHAYLKEVARSPFELVWVIDDRHNYYLTCREWARRLDAASDKIIEKFGNELYRRFRLFLWGSAAGFDTGLVQAYRWLLRLPGSVGAQAR